MGPAESVGLPRPGDDGRRARARGQRGREQVARALCRNPGLSQAALVRMLGIGQTTVSVAVSDLIARGLVVTAGHEASTGGRRAERLTLNPARPLALGIDLGEAEAQIGVVTTHGEVLDTLVAPFVRGHDSVRVGPLTRAAQELAANWPDVAAVGIAVPGVVDVAAGVVLDSASLGWRGAPVRSRFEEALGKPVIVDRNVNASMLGEEWWGSADGDPLVFVTVGSGVGAGLRVNGGFVHGATGVAGEFGHLTVKSTGPLCRCGRRGCLETLASAPALVHADHQLRVVAGGSAPRRTIAQIAAAAADGDPAADRAVSEVARWLGAGLIALATLLNPHAVMLGGELMTAGEVLLPRLRDVVSGRGLPMPSNAAKDAVRIVSSTFGDRAALVGAGALAFDQLFRAI